ncbi:hypothetical protein [uncultured Dokdonia sp.]|uniref:hypothetical protein n=1 Tax=uncultured Dokdonia sp. TaxID=575653 RepID=UPI00260D23F0|nr:hypothetical protein [uncultured Dokdonia sp.]
MIQNDIKKATPALVDSHVEVQELVEAVTTTTYYENMWFWIAAIEIVVIIILLLKLFRKKSIDSSLDDIAMSKLKKARKSSVDMNELMLSINGAKGLYKELSRVCHPDRFVNSDLQGEAQEIFQEISKHKRDYSKLLALKEQAKTTLNINFK